MIPYLVTLIALAIFAIRAQRVKNKPGEIHEHFDPDTAVPISSAGEGDS